VLPLVELEPEVDELVELLVELEVEELVELEVEELVEVLEVMLPEVDELVDTLPELEVVLVIVPELVEVELPPVEVEVELPPVEVEVELPVLELSMSISMSTPLELEPLLLPDVVVVVETLTLPPPLEPPKNPPKKPPMPPKPPEPPITIGVPPLLPQQAVAGAGNCGSGIGTGIIAYSCGGGITRSAVGGRGGITRRAGRCLIGRSGVALADL
jgi:hypothetical protein